MVHVKKKRLDDIFYWSISMALFYYKDCLRNRKQTLTKNKGCSHFQTFLIFDPRIKGEVHPEIKLVLIGVEK